ncbi:amidohydrolase [Deinococcus psychrotolerans]|uniref:Amidohydrolase n=1 Tax=Deinococcus psychrotolerans TaxID=2489213 RepID=A0A3G8YDY9_9DEIO|nr:carbon-nitrogen hydrolase family protein [Deinococcus psychrotolerans]AZI43070.1 amidohydrolase [Deinococcus psychrotolerans]
MTLRVAAAAYLCQPYSHWDEYEARLSAWVAGGAAGQAGVLIFPEYASLELISLLPPALWDDVQAQREPLQTFLPAFLELHARLARQYGVYVLAGSFPVEVAAGHFVNRAHFFGPDGQAGFQDKLVMTRFEAEEWSIDSGEGVKVFDTEYGKLGVNICYDAEFPDFARQQAAAGMDVLLIPSFTGSAHGYTRVRVGGMARALENQIYAVHAPCLADAPWSYAIETAVGAAAIYAPADDGLPENGIVAAGDFNVPDWLIHDLDLSLIREVRCSGHVLNARDQVWAQRQAEGPVVAVPFKISSNEAQP